MLNGLLHVLLKIIEGLIEIVAHPGLPLNAAELALFPFWGRARGGEARQGTLS
jgi:hypothetical protein